MKIRGLCIDDSFSAREKWYQALATEAESHFSFSLQVPTSRTPFEPVEIEELARSCHFALVDIFLDEELEALEIARGIEVLGLLAHANPSAPIFVVSDKWDRVNLRIYDRLLRSRRVVGGFTMDALKNASERPKIRLEINAAVRDAWGIAQEDIGANDDVRIIHLSDFQFGGAMASGHDDATAARLVNEIHDALPVSPSGKTVRPHVLAVTGDIAQRGGPGEFAAGGAFLDKLVAKLRVRREGCFVVPGNHDVCLPLAGAANLSFDPSRPFLVSEDLRQCNPTLVETEAEPNFPSYGLQPFREFARAFMSEDRWRLAPAAGSLAKNVDWFSATKYLAFGVHVLGLNTVGLLSLRCPSRAEIPQATIAEIANHLDNLRSQQVVPGKPLNLLLLHHSPWARDQVRTLGADGTFLMSQMESRGECIVLSGHIHEGQANVRPFTDQAEKQVLYVTASTLSLSSRKRPEDSLGGFNIIHLSRRDGIVQGARVEMFTYQADRYRLQRSDYFEVHPKRGWLRGSMS